MLEGSIWDDFSDEDSREYYLKEDSDHIDAWESFDIDDSYNDYLSSMNDLQFASQPQIINQQDYQQFSNIRCESQHDKYVDNLAIFSNQQNNFIDVAVTSRDWVQVWRIQRHQEKKNQEFQQKSEEMLNIGCSKVVNEQQTKDNDTTYQLQNSKNDDNSGEVIFCHQFRKKAFKSMVAFSPYGKTLVVAVDILVVNSQFNLIFQRESSEQKFEKVFDVVRVNSQFAELKQIASGKWGDKQLLGIARYCYEQSSITFLNISDSKIQDPKDISFQLDQQNNNNNSNSNSNKKLTNCEDEVQVIIGDIFQNYKQVQKFSFAVPAIKLEHKVNSFCFSKQGDLFVIATKSEYLQLHFLNSEKFECKFLRPPKERYATFPLDQVTLNNSGTMLACWKHTNQVCVWKRPSRNSFNFELETIIKGYNCQPGRCMEFAKFNDTLLLHSQDFLGLNLTWFVNDEDGAKYFDKLVHQRIPSILDKSGDGKKFEMCNVRSTPEGDLFVGSKEGLFKWNGFSGKYDLAMNAFSEEVLKKYDLGPCVVQKIKELALHPIDVWFKLEVTRLDLQFKCIRYNIVKKYKERKKSQAKQKPRKRKKLA